jgi:hypothetical protein
MNRSRSQVVSKPNSDVGGIAAGKTAGEIELRGGKDSLPPNAALVSPEERDSRISRAAYLRAEARGFAPGGEMEDWLSAERQIDAELND